jgi:hypothetical protein
MVNLKEKTSSTFMRVEFRGVVTMKTSVFWDMTPCSLLALFFEPEDGCETSISARTTRPYNSEDREYLNLSTIYSGLCYGGVGVRHPPQLRFFLIC